MKTIKSFINWIRSQFTADVKVTVETVKPKAKTVKKKTVAKTKKA